MNCLNVSIHAPGRGRRCARPGNSEKHEVGRLEMSAIAVKARNSWKGGKVKAAPRAGAKSGAVQGVATTTAKTALKNEPPKPARAVRFQSLR